MRRFRLALLGGLLTQLFSTEAAAPFKSQYGASMTIADASLTPKGLEPSSPPPTPPRLIINDASMGSLLSGMPELLMPESSVTPDDPGSMHATQLLVRPAARQANATRVAAAMAPGGASCGASPCTAPAAAGAKKTGSLAGPLLLPPALAAALSTSAWTLLQRRGGHRAASVSSPRLWNRVLVMLLLASRLPTGIAHPSSARASASDSHLGGSASLDTTPPAGVVPAASGCAINQLALGHLSEAATKLAAQEAQISALSAKIAQMSAAPGGHPIMMPVGAVESSAATLAIDEDSLPSSKRWLSESCACEAVQVAPPFGEASGAIDGVACAGREAAVSCTFVPPPPPPLLMGRQSQCAVFDTSSTISSSEMTDTDATCRLPTCDCAQHRSTMPSALPRLSALCDATAGCRACAVHCCTGISLAKELGDELDGSSGSQNAATPGKSARAVEMAVGASDDEMCEMRRATVVELPHESGIISSLLGADSASGFCGTNTSRGVIARAELETGREPWLRGRLGLDKGEYDVHVALSDDPYSFFRTHAGDTAVLIEVPDGTTLDECLGRLLGEPLSSVSGAAGAAMLISSMPMYGADREWFAATSRRHPNTPDWTGRSSLPTLATSLDELTTIGEVATGSLLTPATNYV